MPGIYRLVAGLGLEPRNPREQIYSLPKRPFFLMKLKLSPLRAVFVTFKDSLRQRTTCYDRGRHLAAADKSIYSSGYEEGHEGSLVLHNDAVLSLVIICGGIMNIVP